MATIPDDCLLDIVRYLRFNLRDLFALAATCNSFSALIAQPNFIRVLLDQVDFDFKTADAVHVLRKFKNSPVVKLWLGKIPWHRQISMIKVDQEDEGVRSVLTENLLKNISKQETADRNQILWELHVHGMVPSICPSNIAESIQAQIEAVKFAVLYPSRALRLVQALGLVLVLCLFHPWIVTSMLIFRMVYDVFVAGVRPQLSAIIAFCASAILSLKKRFQ